ncbi:uncharacterized protein LOC134083007 isoform X2 [Sardina pilchardus]|uniref:uncharacterized protein LOC134083007 isoform X2 n=1 Tax=Sardina pilchardus TaxID=27697 RepID=UPI002E0EECDC
MMSSYLVIACMSCCFAVAKSEGLGFQCVGTREGHVDKFRITPSIAASVVDPERHCSTSWSCNNTQCAYYENDGQTDTQFTSPVVNGSFEALVVANDVLNVVMFSADCPKMNFVVILPCSYDRLYTSTSSPSPFPEHVQGFKLPQRETIIACVVAAIFTVLGCLAVVWCLKKSRRGVPDAHDQDIDLQNMASRRQIL